MEEEISALLGKVDLLHESDFEGPLVFSEDGDSISVSSDEYFLEDALILAIKNGQSDTVKEYVSYGVNLNYINDEGYTPLSVAVIYQYFEIVDFLLRNGAKVNQVDKYDYTALMYAIFADQIMVNLLIYHGADPNFANQDGETPLILASREDRYLEIEALLKSGADPCYKNKDGDTAADIAKQFDSNEALDALTVFNF